jgi:hypothetical protein
MAPAWHAIYPSLETEVKKAVYTCVLFREEQNANLLVHLRAL